MHRNDDDIKTIELLCTSTKQSDMERLLVYDAKYDSVAQ